MRNRVTVIPSDLIIIVDYEPLELDFSASANVHAVQWENGAGQIEYNDGTAPRMLSGQGDYDQYVAPFVALWEAEKARLDAIANAPLTDEEQYNAERAAVEARYSAPWNGTSGGRLPTLQTTIVAALATGADPAGLYAEYNSALDAMNAELSAIDEKWGVA